MITSVGVTDDLRPSINSCQLSQPECSPNYGQQVLEALVEIKALFGRGVILSRHNDGLVNDCSYDSPDNILRHYPSSLLAVRVALR